MMMFGSGGRLGSRPKKTEQLRKADKQPAVLPTKENVDKA